MLNYNSEISKPKNPQDFEELCLAIYRVVYDDKTATKNGRSGQEQNGVDIYVQQGGDRVGIQCKRVNFGKLTTKIIDKEVGHADAGKIEITKLIIATTAANDARLIEYTALLSDQRKGEGRFRVDLAFWDTLESHIQQHPQLQYLFAPNSVGGAFYGINQQLQPLQQLAQYGRQIQEIHAAVISAPKSLLSSLSEGRNESLNKFITGQLDDIRNIILAGRYKDALTRLGTLGASINDFDAHQKSRWHSQRGTCYWRTGEGEVASVEYEKAYKLAPDDEKAAGNAIRACLLREKPDEALSLSKKLIEQFPVSIAVWASWANSMQVAGQTVKLTDVPPELRRVSDIQHVFSWVAFNQGDKELALSLAKAALENSPNSFDIRASFLRCVLAVATEDAVRASLGAIEPRIAALLDQSIAAFLPLQEKLWPFQSSESLCEALVHLGYVLMIRGRRQEARELLKDGVDELPGEKPLARAYLESLQRSDAIDEAYQFGLTRLDYFDEVGLIMVAEMAANRGDLSTMLDIRERIGRSPEGRKYQEDTESLFWIALWRNEKFDDLDVAFEQSNIGESLNINLLSVATRIQSHRQQTKKANELSERMLSLVSADTTKGVLIQVAEACAAIGKYHDTARLLKRALPTGICTELHEKLLFAYIKSGNRKRARGLLHTFPADSFQNEQVRRLAIEVAQDANDWNELSKLAEMELENRPGQADAWLFRAIVSLRQRKFDELKDLLGKTPVSLVGTTRIMAQLARLEIQFDGEEKGFARIYRRLRENLENTEAASAYFMLSATASPNLMREALTMVAPGTTVRLRADGQERNLTIDPELAGSLPAHPEFACVADEFSQDLLGKSIGDKVCIKEAFGFVHEYEVLGVTSAYRYLGEKAIELIRRSVRPVEGVLSIPILQGPDGKPDFRHVLEQLKKKSERAKLAFGAYGEGKITLGMLASLLSTSSAVLAGDWPGACETSLYMCNGTVREREEARRLILDGRQAAVTDLITVVEIVSCECEESLQLIAPVLIPEEALTTLAELISDSDNDSSTGTLYEENGQLGFLQRTEQDKTRRAAFLRRIESCINTYCKPLPAYGPEDLPKDIQWLQGILDSESYDLLLLAIEHQTAILTLDGRLRDIAWECGKIPGYWPQALANAALEKGVISQGAYSWGLIYQLAKRRSHVSLNSSDLLWLLLQAPEMMQDGFRIVRKHLSDPRIEIASAFQVVIDLIAAMISRGMVLAVIGEVLEKLLRAIFLHPAIDKDTARGMFCWYLMALLEDSFRDSKNHYLFSRPAMQRHRLWEEYLFGAVRRATEPTQLSDEVLLDQPLRVKVLFCSAFPKLVYVTDDM
jgi:tetratricopeptide (TPR) repeat protein